jgi:hypothetical protein
MNVRVGSKADLTLGANDVGSYFENGHGVRQSKVMEEIGRWPTASNDEVFVFVSV